jgi:hypothetical protein
VIAQLIGRKADVAVMLMVVRRRQLDLLDLWDG